MFFIFRGRPRPTPPNTTLKAQAMHLIATAPIK